MPITLTETVEEEVCLLSNQKLRCYKQCACEVEQIFHVLYVVSGGGHRHLSKTEVSYNRQRARDTAKS